MSLIKNNLKYRILLLFFLIIFFSCQETYASKDFNYFNFIKEMKSFSSSFIQNTYNENGLLVTTSKGNLTYKKKSKYVLLTISRWLIEWCQDSAAILLPNKRPKDILTILMYDDVTAILGYFWWYEVARVVFILVAQEYFFYTNNPNF